MDKEEKKPQEDKEQGKNPLDISRRTFLKGMGTTAIATSITISPLSLPSISRCRPASCGQGSVDSTQRQ